MGGVAAHGDFETRSTLELRKVGAYRYAVHPTTGIWVLHWRIGEGPIQEWRPGWPFPTELAEHVALGGIFIAHNAAFERLIWNNVLRRYVPWLPMLQREQMSCTMARAYAMGLPGPLEQVAPIVAPGIEKDMEGHRLMKQMAKPRKVLPSGMIIWWDEPEKIERISTYCGLDVEAETAVDLKVPALTPREHAVWQLDQQINDRGVRIDRHLVNRAIELVNVAKVHANRRMSELTGGAIDTVGQTAKIVNYLQSRNIPCTSMKKGGHDELIAIAELIDDPVAKGVVELRRDGYKSSTAKLPAMLECASEIDDAARGLLSYHATTTGRWAGRLIQPQNFPRVDPDRDLPTVLAIIELLLSQMPAAGVYEALTAMYGEVMPWMAKILRSCLIAREGKEFVGGDLSNIEGRINAWLAGERWKLDAFRAYDAGAGPDLYKIAASLAFGIPIDQVDKTLRQLGKVQELALGYQGAIGAFLSMVDTYQMKIIDLVEPVYKMTPSQVWDTTQARYTKASSFNLPEMWWTAIKVLVDSFRAANPMITMSWWERQDAAIDAVMNPGVLYPLFGGRVAYMSTGDALLCRLPSSRILHYWNPRIVQKPDQIEVLDEDGNLVDLIDYQDDEDRAVAYMTVGIDPSLQLGRTRHGKRSVCYDGLDRKTRKWGTRYMYGGQQCENEVSGTARDVLVEAMFRCERAGFPIVLTVHDEILAEVEKGFGASEDESYFAGLLSENPDFLPGCPLAAAAFRDVRYSK